MRFWRRYRSIILGVVATLLLGWSAVHNFDVDWRVMLTFLGYSAALVLLMMLLGGVGALIVVTLKKVFGKD